MQKRNDDDDFEKNENDASTGNGKFCSSVEQSHLHRFIVVMGVLIGIYNEIFTCCPLIRVKEFSFWTYFAFSEFHSLPEDVELAKQLNEWGLPLSFQTNKEVLKNNFTLMHLFIDFCSHMLGLAT